MPWDAWISQATCVGKETQPQCATITQAAYRPGIVYPQQFFEMEPEWRSCSSGMFGIVDPPIALKAGHTVAGPTHGGEAPITSEPAIPLPTQSHDLPMSTSAQSSQDPDNNGSTITATSAQVTETDTIIKTRTKTVVRTSIVTGITIDPITKSKLPGLTSMDPNHDVSASKASDAASSTASTLASSSNAAESGRLTLYTALLTLPIPLLQYFVD